MHIKVESDGCHMAVWYCRRCKEWHETQVDTYCTADDYDKIERTEKITTKIKEGGQ